MENAQVFSNLVVVLNLSFDTSRQILLDSVSLARNRYLFFVNLVDFSELENFVSENNSVLQSYGVLYCIDSFAEASQKISDFKEKISQFSDFVTNATSVDFMFLSRSADNLELSPKSKDLLTQVDHFIGTDSPIMARCCISSYIFHALNSEICGVIDTLKNSTYADRRTLLKSREREELRAQLAEFVDRIGRDVDRDLQTYGRFACEVQDELLMNAIWDANPKLTKHDRKIALVLPVHEGVKVEWAFDGQCLGVSVFDSFGSFTRDAAKLYAKYLFNSGPRREQIKLNSEGEGAGIGLYMVLERVSALQIWVQPGVGTSVSALFDLSRPLRKIGHKSKSLQFFSAPKKSAI